MIYLRPREVVVPFLALVRPTALLVILYWLLGGQDARAAALPVEALRDAALAQARVTIPDPGAELRVTALDPRLRLAACAGPLAARTVSDTGSALSIELRCDSAGWKLFVPVSVRVEVPVLVATRPLARGQAVGSDDVQVQRRDRAALGAGWVGALEQLDGRVLNRAVAAGSVLLPSQFAAERLVRRGQAVVLVAARGGFLVRSQGKALADASAGERVRVQSASSKRVVEGRVQADGSVAVSL